MSGTALGHHALGAGREFDVVRALLARWGDAAHGVGDDAAVLDVPAGARLVVSTDASVEGAHFRRGWLAPEEIGWRATAGALSDLAAMAARPLGLVLALALPDAWREQAGALADGVGAAARTAGCPIVGGDLVRATELALTVTVLGTAAAPLGRDGAGVGDVLYVTGRLGGPGLALRALLAGAPPSAEARARFARPVPRLAEARWLAERGATAMIDVSDGLLGDLAHVAAASGVRLEIDPDAVPRIDGATVRDALASGEEYELACTAPAGLPLGEFAARFGIPLTVIGRVERGVAGVVLPDGRDARVEFPSGHDHFSP